MATSLEAVASKLDKFVPLSNKTIIFMFDYTITQISVTFKVLFDTYYVSYKKCDVIHG